MCIRDRDAGPSKDWLTFVATPKAASRIRSWFSRERKHEFAEMGKEELSGSLRRAGIAVQRTLKSKDLVEIAVDMNYTDLEALFVAIGEGHVGARTIINRLNRLHQPDDVPDDGALSAERISRARRSNQSTIPTGGVHVEGLDDLLVRLADCCTPVPGDDIVGFVTRGRGVSVHRGDCANAVSLQLEQSDRLIDVEWYGRPGQEQMLEASVEVTAIDGPGLLSEIAGVMAATGINVLKVDTTTNADRMAHMLSLIHI